MQENCKDNLNTWKDKADERRREMAAIEAKVSQENSKEKQHDAVGKGIHSAGNSIFITTNSP